MKTKNRMHPNRGALAMALAGLAFLAIGCGGGQEARTSADGGADPQLVAASASGPVASPLTAGGRQAATAPESIAAVTNDSLPPDVHASISDPLVTPGTIIEITAEGSPDVEEVVLSDGMGRPQRFAYDPPADRWRAAYRVPVKVTGDRLALSVTARNQLHRWRRVWVFLNIQREVVKEEPAVDEK